MTKRDSQLQDYASEERRFYGVDGHGLTDAERAAVTKGIEALEEDSSIERIFNDGLANASQAYADTLRSLLERMP